MTAPHDLRSVDSADVYVGDTLTAILTRSTRGTVLLKYLADTPLARSEAIAWSVPWTPRPIRTDAGNVPPFFAGLLPEGVRLGVVLDATKTSVDDQFTLLLAVGSDTVGNVRVVPLGTDPKPPEPMVDPDDIDDLEAVFAAMAGSFSADPIALAGVQPKVSSAMWSTPASTTSGAAILKLAPARFPQILENEHFFMSMAAELGLRAARTRLVRDRAGRPGLLVERFDRAGADRIPQEDACQVKGVYPASKYLIKTESALLTLAEACEQGGGSRSAAMLELLRWVAFSWLIGNGDLHGKNLSIHAANDVWRPTPVYDLLCSQPYLRWQDPMALNFYGRDGRFTRQHFLDSGERLGLPRRAIVRMLDDLVAGAPAWIDRCGEIGFDAPTTDRLVTFLGDRVSTLS